MPRPPAAVIPSQATANGKGSNRQADLLLAAVKCDDAPAQSIPHRLLTANDHANEATLWWQQLRPRWLCCGSLSIRAFRLPRASDSLAA